MKEMAIGILAIGGFLLILILAEWVAPSACSPGGICP